MSNRLEQQLRNTYDAKMKSRSIEQQKRWGRRRQLKLHRLMCDELRAQINHNCFCLTLARSLCIEHQYIPVQAYDDLCREQLLISKATLVKAKLGLKDFYPETPFEVSDDFILCSIHNLDIYSRKTHSRLKNGEMIKSNMIHAVVSERLLFDKAILSSSQGHRL